MATKEEVQRFLNQMKEKIKVFGIIYRDDRGKNAQTLIDLEITPKYRDSVIINIEVEDYSEGLSLTLSTNVERCGSLEKTLKGRKFTSRLHWERDQVHYAFLSTLQNTR